MLPRLDSLLGVVISPPQSPEQQGRQNSWSGHLLRKKKYPDFQSQPELYTQSMNYRKPIYPFQSQFVQL